MLFVVVIVSFVALAIVRARVGGTRREAVKRAETFAGGEPRFKPAAFTRYPTGGRRRLFR
jgi:hypothetical protein